MRIKDNFNSISAFSRKHLTWLGFQGDARNCSVQKYMPEGIRADTHLHAILPTCMTMSAIVPDCIRPPSLMHAFSSLYMATFSYAHF